MFEQELKDYLEGALCVEVTLEQPPRPELGDIAVPCFGYAKQLKKSPAQIAAQFVEKLTHPPHFVKSISAVGPYLNITFNKSLVAQNIIKRILSSRDDFGKSTKGKNKTVVIEYASPNTNKPLHLGHIRNICLGTALSNLYSSQGYHVVRANIVNDRGIHICKAMLAYALHGNGKTPESTGTKSDHFVGEYYVKFAQDAETNPKLIEQAQDMLNKWEADDPKTHELWRTLRAWCEEGFNKTYAALGVGFDRIDYESNIWKSGKEIVLDGLKRSAFVKDETGAVIAKLSESSKLPDKVLLRSDGTALYMTQDLFLAVSRHNELHFEKMFYVVGSEQNMHFAILFKLLSMLGFPWAAHCHHYSYGMVYLPEGKMKSREGIVVDADDIIFQMSDLAREEIVKRDNTLHEAELHERAHSVGLAALKFMMLKVDAQKDITFDSKASVSFEGDTGPYLQYTHARAASILGKLLDENKNSSMSHFASLDTIEEQLVMILSKFEYTIHEAFVNQKPHILVQYLITLAQTFNEFYHLKPVVKEADEPLRDNRISLVHATKQILANGLRIIGIIPLERM